MTEDTSAPAGEMPAAFFPGVLEVALHGLGPWPGLTAIEPVPVELP
jgi:hypothetical protein